ncbi:MAG TPA: DNA primase [Bryobacteraceae bacterium]|nr:DNA primase [Bryobacteraceae bacterium]
MDPFVEHLKSSIDIVKVIGDYVRLKRVGATGRYVGLCPFHQEKTPSFSVNQTRQFFKCFGCGVGGDSLKFVMDIDGLTFPEALKLLAESNGIPMPKKTEYADAESKQRAALLEIHEIAANLFQSNLRGPHGADARSYLNQRAVSPELIDTFMLGYSDSSGQSLVRRLSQERFTAEQLDASGLVRRREDGSLYDYFRGRLMFPIHNESGRVIAFGGRAMREEDQPKYLNSPETPIYKKTSVLYNLHRARDGMRRSERVILVEGYMDVIGVCAAGVKEVVASCGTSLTNPQVRTMQRLTAGGTVIVNFDPDNAGAAAAERAIQLLLDEGLHVRVLSLDGGLDPDEYVKQKGADAYRAKLDSASGYFHWLADRARARFDMRSSDGRMDAFKFLLPSVQKLSDKLERAAIANDLAGYIGVDPGLVLDQFKKAAAERRTPPPKPDAKPAVPANEALLLQAILSNEDVRTQILPRIPPDTTSHFITREIFEALRHQSESGSPVTFSSIEDRLNPAARDLLHEVAAADEISEGALALEQAQACLRRLELDFRRKQLDELRARVKTAEREGRLNEALDIIAELERLRKEINAAGRD